jgi:hypothetical protein
MRVKVMNKEQPKKRKNSRAKGAAYERKICKLLMPWWNCEFHRVPASGGLRWKQDNRVTGDIVVQEDVKDFPFVIECKKREGWNFEQIIKGTGEVVSWWEQNITDIHRLGDVNKRPLVIFSKNMSPDYFMILASDWEKLHLPHKNYFKTTFDAKIDGEDISREYSVVIGMLEDLLKLDKEKVIERI